MSRLIKLFHLVLAWLNAPTAPQVEDPDLTPRDWADLPTHHPLCDCTPC